MTTRPALELVSFTGPGARILLWGYVLTIGALGVWSLDEVDTAWPTIVGLHVLLGVGILLTIDRSEPLRRGTAVAVAVAWVAVALLISWHLLVPGGHAQWYFGAGTVSLFYVSLRGRMLIGWIGFAALSAVIVAWGATTEVGLVTGLLLVGKQLPIFLVSVLFAVGMRRTTATIVRISDETAARAAVEAAQLASTDARRSRLDELDTVATPLLRRLVDGGAVTDADRVDFAVAEAALRDGLRARTLAVPLVTAAANAARRRGVEVVLLDDRYPETLDDAILLRVIGTVADAITAATDGRVVARLLPAGRDDIATVLVETTDGRDHIVIPAVR